MKRFVIISLVLGVLLIGLPVFGAIDFGDESLGSDVNTTEVVDKVQDAIGDISLDSINSTTTVETAKSLFVKIGELFKKLQTWLRDRAGIDIIGIFKTLLTWFVAVVEWMIELIKWLLAKI